MQNFNDNVLNILKSTKKMIDHVSSQKAKKDLTKIAMSESTLFCRLNNYSNVSEISAAQISVLEDNIWVRFEKYGAF